MIVHHEFGPCFALDAKILILGSFPSLKSREQQFYYAHPQNRFWPVLAKVFADKQPMSVVEKQAFLKKHHIALWDVIESCEINNSDDSSIKNVVSTDLAIILEQCAIERIYCLGNVAGRYFKKFHPELMAIMSVLPSSSGANANYDFDRLYECYKVMNIEGLLK
ncbi:MAG: DNA-deoxyinosine glycosylase [Erysipelotrichaceae bacterium]|nr:DNA-deoxyinosine glycosylase [Erysipelotrichaceae bacterium]MDY5252734.1 DNA-deoxyinosine glycosylase [Erysipelotrichaceae bacterium]